MRTLLTGLWRAALIGSLLGAHAEALTMGELLNDSDLTPKRFAKEFADFKFALHPETDVLSPDTFLEERCGDCIDYAVLANHVLKHHGYHTRLIRVELVGRSIGHAICYVTESEAYLDYNNREYFMKLERSGQTVREIAAEVADSFNANWTFASEFTYNYREDVKRAVYTVVKTDPPASDPDHDRPYRPQARS